MSDFTTFNVMLEVLTTVIRGEQETIGIQIGKGEMKLSFADMIVYVENSKECTKILLELSKFNKVERHKINTQKSIALIILTMNQNKEYSTIYNCCKT